MENKMIEELGFKLDYKDEKLFIESVNSKFDSSEKAEKALESFENETFAAVSKPLYQGEKTDSKRFNLQFENVLSDLLKLFTLANKTSAIIDSNTNLYDQFIFRLKENLKVIENKIEAYSYIAGSTDGFSEVKYENFDDKSSFENFDDETRILFNNPKIPFNNAGLLSSSTNLGSILGPEFEADINKYSDSLTLAPIGKIKPEAPIVEMEEQVGKYLKVKNSLYPLENVTKNDKPEMVWSETILSDQPFEVEMEGEKKGAVFKFRIIFEKPMPINNISIDPFSKYPMEILKIRSYENAEDYMKGEDFAETILSEGFESYFDPEYLNDAATLEFPTKNIQVIEFVINQKHYELEQFSLKESEKNDINLAEKIYSSQNTVLNLGESTSESLLELDYSNNSVLWDYLKNMVEDFFKQLDIDNKNEVIGNILNSLSSLIPELSSKKFSAISQKNYEKKNERIIGLNKYSYQYGFKNIEPSYKEYRDRGIYVSKPYLFASDVRQVSLVVDEKNQTLYHSDSEIPTTSIEYYITNLKNPSPRNASWYPILPENHKFEDENGNKIIKGERIFPIDMGGSLEAILRFPVKEESLKVFKNGEELPESDFSLNNSMAPLTLADKYISNHNNNIYTVNYTVSPDFNPTLFDVEEWVSPVKFIDEDGKDGERFKIEDSEVIRLKYYPYINRESIYSSQEVDVKAGDTNENPMFGSYNPNYKKCYSPIKIDGFGEIEYFNGSEIKKEEREIKQDQSGIPYRFKYFKDTNNDGIIEDFEYRKTVAPYFFNKTDYKSDGGSLFGESAQAPLYEYSEKEYPVYEYYQKDKNIFFNKALDSGQKDAELRVKYEYLTECIRLKVIMYRNVKHNYGTTPVLKNYAIKVNNAENTKALTGGEPVQTM